MTRRPTSSAESLLLEAIGTAIQLGVQGTIVGVLDSLAGVYTSQNRYDPAIRLLAAADSYRISHGLSLDQEERRRVDAIINKARAKAGPIRFGLAWAGGSALNVRQAANEVLQGARPQNLSSTSGDTPSSVPPAAASDENFAPSV